MYTNGENLCSMSMRSPHQQVSSKDKGALSVNREGF